MSSFQRQQKKERRYRKALRVLKRAYSGRLAKTKIAKYGCVKCGCRVYAGGLCHDHYNAMLDAQRQERRLLEVVA